MDTNGAVESVLFSGVLISGVARVVLWARKVSCLERCPQFRGVLIEGSTVQPRASVQGCPY